MELVMKHVVGKSTLKEGFAVPRDFELWIGATDKGCKRDIFLEVDGQSILATLRRVNNEQGSVQVKYENSAGEIFRNWLTMLFYSNDSSYTGGFIEIHRIGSDKFQVIAFPQRESCTPSLIIEQWLFHRGSDLLFEQDTPLAEIPTVIHAIPFSDGEGQRFYNQAFSRSFKDWNWNCECRVMQKLGLKCDFAKDGVQVEVEFGNARTYYQDFVKFMLGNRYSGLELGVLVVPTVSFSKHLCEIGRQRAIQKGRSQYSGMIDFDKVHREFEYLKFILEMPIAIAGVGSTEL